MNNDFFSIVISAPSGAGKTTIIHEVLKINNKLEFVISTTARPNRGSEINGESYYFINKDEFKIKINNNEFIEWAKVHDNYYGTTKKEIDRILNLGKIPLFDVDVQGAGNFKNNFKNIVYIFILPPTIKELIKRLKNRKTDSKEQINIRINAALKEFTFYKNYDYLVVNDKLADAVNVISAIICSELHKTNRKESIIKTILEEHGDNTIK